MSDLAALNKSAMVSSGASDFVELSRIHVLATHGNHSAIARLRSTSGRVLDLIGKGAVAVGATSDAGAAGILQNLSQAFLQSLGLFSAFDQILTAGGFLRVPLRTRVSVVTLAGNAYTVGEADAKPISRMSLAANEIQSWKTVGITVLTDELVRSISSVAAEFIGNELRRAVGYTADQAFTSLLIDSTGAPTVASAGSAAANFLSDLGNALEQISYGATSRLFLIVPPALNKRLLIMRDSGGWILADGAVGAGIRIVCSDALTDTAILLDASQVAAASGDVTVDQSRNSAIALDDNPTADGHLTSLFQANLVAARCERYFGAEVLRDDCLALITGVSVTS
jgi:HK97 family phage major capsid protein